MVVMLHKGIMAFSLGLNLAQAHGMTVKYFITASLIFSLASPTGMAVGIVISDLKDSLSKDVATAILQVIIVNFLKYEINLKWGLPTLAYLERYFIIEFSIVLFSTGDRGWNFSVHHMPRSSTPRICKWQNEATESYQRHFWLPSYRRDHLLH